MKVSALVKLLPLAKPLANLTFANITCDSRKVMSRDIFFVIPNKNFDIFSVLSNIENKVLFFVVGKDNAAKVNSLIRRKPVIFVDDIQRVYYKAIDIYYGFNCPDFKFVGVTGTNGKTTVTSLIHFLLNKIGQKAALLGTVNYIIGLKKYPAVNTTPGYVELRKIFQEAKVKKIKYIVMETSSHGIDQDRIKGIKFSACAFTNLTRDHLDYHKTFENYFAAKQKLFKQNPQATAIVNRDDSYGKRLLRGCLKPLSYSIKSKAKMRACDIIFTQQGTRFNLVYDNKIFPISTPLVGEYNVHNILTALGVMVSLGFSLNKIIKFIPDFHGAQGRLQKVAADVYVDYAHTPDALERVLVTLRSVGYNYIICVFGCGGNRDHGKRPIMGEIASRCADFSFVTSDNPRSENPIDICQAVKDGFKKNNFKIVIDRKDAINLACQHKLNHQNSCLVLCGKGHEDYQIIKGKKLPFKDSDVVRQAIKVTRNQSAETRE